MTATFTVGQRVRILETAFPGSPDERDIKARGQEGAIVNDLEQELGKGWRGCYLVETPNGAHHHLTADEIEAT